MGVYNREGTHNQRPFYLNDNNNRYLYYNPAAGGVWEIGDTLDDNNPRIKKNYTGLQDKIPLGDGGWEYFRSGPRYISDPNLTVTRLGKITMCILKWAVYDLLLDKRPRQAVPRWTYLDENGSS